MNGWSWRKSTHSFANGNCIEVGQRWRRSRHSAASTCVEAGHAAPAIGVRDSKDPDGAVLAFSAAAWTAFCHRLVA